MTLIRATDLTVNYERLPALEHVNVQIEPAEIVTVVGPNGSGKSTLIRALLGIVPLAGGEVWRKPGLRIGYVPQKLSIDETMPLPVARFLRLPHRAPSGEIDKAMQRVGIAGLGDRQMSALSGGQFQRALLARALLGGADILILDEPTQGLDQPGIAEFYRLIAEVRAEIGCAVLMVSHDLHVVMSASDRVICLNHHICCQGAPHVVSETPEYRALFGLGTSGSLALYQHAHDHSHDDGGDAGQQGHRH